MYGIVHIDHYCSLVSYLVPIIVLLYTLVYWYNDHTFVLLFGIIPIVVHYCHNMYWHLLIGIVHWYCTYELSNSLVRSLGIIMYIGIVHYCPLLVSHGHGLIICG